MYLITTWAMSPKEWLENNNWSDGAVEHELFAHHTTISLVMEQYAKEYTNNVLNSIAQQQAASIKKFI